MVDKISKERRSKNMSKIRSKNTSIEIHVRKWLYSKGFRYRINDKRFIGKPDIILPKYKVAIFIHGCFWHGHGVCRYSHIPKSRVEYWNEKIEKNIERDKRNIYALKEIGWKVIIIWECQIKTRFEETMNILVSEIKLNLQ